MTTTMRERHFPRARLPFEFHRGFERLPREARLEVLADGDEELLDLVKYAALAGADDFEQVALYARRAGGIPAESLRGLSRSGNEDVRALVAEATSDGDALAFLAGDRSERVRRIVAANPAAAGLPEVLRKARHAPRGFLLVSQLTSDGDIKRCLPPHTAEAGAIELDAEPPTPPRGHRVLRVEHDWSLSFWSSNFDSSD